MKLVNNVLLAFTAEGVANSFALAHRLGLEASSVLDTSTAAPSCPNGSRESSAVLPGASTPKSSP